MIHGVVGLWVGERGYLLGERPGAPEAAPGTALQISWGAWCFDNVNSADSWASAWPSRPFWLHRNLVVLWPSWLDDTGAGGLMP
jgi:hypothetical protein